MTSGASRQSPRLLPSRDVPGLNLASSIDRSDQERILKDSGTFSKCPQIYIELTGFEDNDSGKLPFKYYLLRLCSL
jgi:hypothetical protein